MQKIIAYIIIGTIGIIILKAFFESLDSVIRTLEIIPWWAWFLITPFVIITLFRDNSK